MTRKSLLLLFWIIAFTNHLAIGQLKNIYDSKLTGFNVLALTLSHQQHQIYFADEQNVYLYNWIDGCLDKKITLRNKTKTTTIALSPNADIVYVGKKDGSVYMFNAISGELLDSMNLQAGVINCMAVSGRDSSLFVGCENGAIINIDHRIAQSQKLFYKQEFPVTGIQSVSDKQLLAASNTNGEILLFDEVKNTLLKNFRYSKNWIRDIDYNKVKGLLYCVGDNGHLVTIKPTPAGNLNILQDMSVSGSWLTTVEATEDGEAIVYGGINNRVFVDTQFAHYTYKTDGLVVKASMIEANNKQIFIVLSIFEKGVYLLPLKDMQFNAI